MALTGRLLSQRLDHVQVIARKIGFNKLEVGMSKLKGTVHNNVNAVSKDGNLLWLQFCHFLIQSICIKHP